MAYFCAGMAVYVFSFATILKKMAQNSKQSKLSEKGDECTFSWKVFASWDYGIANIDTGQVFSKENENESSNSHRELNIGKPSEVF